jgi:hypothetical protein
MVLVIAPKTLFPISTQAQTLEHADVVVDANQ